MQKFSKIKLFLPITTLTLLGTFFINVQKANAGWLGNIARDLLKGLFYIMLNIAQFFTGLAGKIFSAILNFGFRSMSAIELGWTISRDIVNGFFILGLVVIAFATILRVERYGIKQLLPKLIIVALLINFSFVICGVIIDMTQIVSNYFMGQIDVRAEKDIGEVLIAKLELGKTLEGEAQDLNLKIGEEGGDDIAILSMAFAAAIIFITGIALLIGAVLLIFRTGALWALIVLAPFAWFFSIFPGLNQHARKWWSEFTKWAFFAPIYLFFIYLIIKISEETIVASVNNPAALSNITFTPMLQSIDMLFKFVFLIILMFGAPQIAMSLGIKSAGVVTGRVRGAFKAGGKLASRGISRATRRPREAVKTGVKAGTVGMIGKRLFRGEKTMVGRRMKAKALQIKGRPEEMPQHKKYASLLGTMSNDNLKEEISKAKGVRKLIATKEASRRGVLKGAGKETKLAAIKSLRSYGAVDAAMEMEQRSPETLIRTDKKGNVIKPTQQEEQRLKETLAMAHEKGTDKNFDASTFAAPEGTMIIKQLKDMLNPSEFNELFKKWGKDTQKAAATALQSEFNDDFIRKPGPKGKETNQNILDRETIAKNTGELDRAFLRNSEDKTIKLKPGEKGIDTNIKDGEGNSVKISKDIDLVIQNHIKSLDGDGFGKLRNKESRMLAARHMTTGQVENAGVKLDGNKQEEIKNEIKRLINDPGIDAAIKESRKRVLEQMEKSLSWGGSINASPHQVNLKEKTTGATTYESEKSKKEKQEVKQADENLRSDKFGQKKDKKEKPDTSSLSDPF